MTSARRGDLLYGVVTLIFCVIASPVAGQGPGDLLGPSSSLQAVGEQLDGRLRIQAQNVRSRWIEGALVGAALGGASGWLLYEVAAPDFCDTSDPNCEESGLTKGSSIVLGVGLGALIGGLVGTRFQAGFSVGPFGTAAAVIDLDGASRIRGRVSIPWK